MPRHLASSGLTRVCLLLVAALVGTACAGVGDLLGLRGGLVPLMKADGWRDELGSSLPPFAVLEIAYDEETAVRAWADNTPDGLPERSGTPEEPGIYGDLADVDFDEQVVVVWSSGQSSACPGWLDALDTTPDGRVEVERGQAGRACTDDYNPYRMILAVDRQRVPSADLLPTEDVAGVPEAPGALVTTYPADH